MNNANLVRVVVKRGRRVSLNQHSRRYEPGEVIEVDPSTAASLIRSGFAEALQVASDATNPQD